MMAHFRDIYVPNATAYLQYYQDQAGGNLARFQGGQHGYGLGSLIRSIIRRIIPIGSKIVKAARPVAKRAIEIARPHVREAVSEIAKEAGRKITDTWAVDRNSAKEQKGGRKARRTARVQRRKRPYIKTKRSRTDFIPDIF